MKHSPLSILLLFVFACSAAAQSDSTLSLRWKWLVGNWKGEGKGKPGKGYGGFSLQEQLGGKVLLRQSRSVYPASATMPTVVHEDLTTIYSTTNGDRAMYFDNEGHKINYAITYSPGKIMLNTDLVQGLPLFRLSYTHVDDRTIRVRFEMAQDGEHFMTYTDGVCKKITKSR